MVFDVLEVFVDVFEVFEVFVGSSVLVVEPESVEVAVAVAVHGVVGLSPTQSQRAATELNTWRPVARPHSSVTQPRAAFWITAEAEHWHS